MNAMRQQPHLQMRSQTNKHFVFDSPPSCLCQVAVAASDSNWRRNRLSDEEFVQRQLEQGKKVSPLFAIPGFSTKFFRRDWLHIEDQGVGADFIGNVFKTLLAFMPGANKKARRLALWDLIRTFYDANNVQDRMVGLRHWGIQAPKKTPKLKASAAAARALIPFCDEQCRILLDPTNAVHEAIINAAHHLHECYRCLSTDAVDWKNKLEQNSKDFAVQYKALQDFHEGTKAWRVKPKMHQFLEMCSSSSKPNMSWTYRDEDFGGTVAQLCRIKGGCWKKVLAYSKKMLLLFQTKHKVPRIK